jgi:hypothetical protein
MPSRSAAKGVVYAIGASSSIHPEIGHEAEQGFDLHHSIQRLDRDAEGFEELDVAVGTIRGIRLHWYLQREEG